MLPVPSTAIESKSTLNARVLARIRSDIVTCRLLPDDRLRMEALRARYEVGTTPIREALMRLEAEGLVRLEQNKGFRVAGVSRESLLDLMRCRIEIEGLALRWSMERGGVDWEANLLGAFHRLSHERKVEAHDKSSIRPEWSIRHRAFHLALVAACASPALLAIRDGLFDQAERYVALSIMSRAVLRNDVAEHEGIMRAALARDVDKAMRLMSEHIERTAEKVARSLVQSRATPKLQFTNGRPVRQAPRA
jgi:DNA-binding GntR family transcriptional regulator